MFPLKYKNLKFLREKIMVHVDICRHMTAENMKDIHGENESSPKQELYAQYGQ